MALSNAERRTLTTQQSLNRTITNSFVFLSQNYSGCVIRSIEQLMRIKSQKKVREKEKDLYKCQNFMFLKMFSQLDSNLAGLALAACFSQPKMIIMSNKTKVGQFRA